MTTVELALLYATLAGATIPLGGVTAQVENFRRRWVELEFRHGVMAFGGGALLAAVALVLVPEGTRHLSPPASAGALAFGGIVTMLADRAVQRRGGAGAQVMAMLLDYVPEAMALGAMLAAAGGILYLTFQDIAPQAKLARDWWPPLGAVLGFLVGMVGQQLIG